MAITRTSQVDDDGTGTTGTVYNNAWKTELYNQIDGTFAPIKAPVRLSPHIVYSITAGQVDNIDPGGVGSQYTVYLLSSTVPTYLTGLKAEADGTMKLLINTSGPLITIAHLFASTAANQIIGAGFANTDLPTWRALWLIYNTGFNNWMVLKP